MRLRVPRLLAGLYMSLFVLFMLLPIFFVMVNSFNQARFSIFPPQGLSFRWYVNLLEVRAFFQAMRNSVAIAICTSLLAMLIGAAAALAIIRGPWRRRELIQSGFFAPLLVPRIVLGIAVFVAAIKVGFYPSFSSIILAHTVLVLPYVMSLVAANLLQVQRSQEEAAMDLGANAWQTFRLATVPQITRGLILAALFAFILSFDEFDVSLFLAREQNMTLPIRMFLYMQEVEDPTLAALATLLIALSVGAALVIRRVSRGMDLIDLLRQKGAP